MKSDLEELIDAYEEEKTQLEKQISEYVEEADYLYAHYHSKALSALTKTLEILKNLHNPVHRNIVEEDKRIQGYNKMLKGSGDDSLKPYMTNLLLQGIKESENKIQEFKKIKMQSSYDSQEIDDALFSLVNNDIKSFALRINRPSKLSIRFEIVINVIEIKLSFDEENEQIKYNQLRHAGFFLQHHEWVYQYPLSRFKNSLEIKMMLSHLIYDLFEYDSRYETAELIYH